MTYDRDELLKKLASLPDYPAIRDVAQALWGAGEIRGAAVMVGAGFSRNAELVSNFAPPPLWTDFSRRMGAALYPTDPNMVLSDPLRLAEEYRSALGQPALDALIRELVADQKWLPGELHRALMRLPWADVLTTNWDTLLERAAAEDHERGYEVVETIEAIARTRAPRIVKLHGSLSAQTPFIFTEQDFRTYPQKFSPFVNLAQQVMLENELVLLGFSGDDPNFLQWAGWVRDQLGASARRIRLVGVLNLTPSRRRLLEGQNITPVDLAPIVEKVDPADSHRLATEIFLAALLAARPEAPSAWRLSHMSPSDAAGVEDVIEKWTEERKSYPGWLIAPPEQRKWLSLTTGPAIGRLARDFQKCDIRLKAKIAFELTWRCTIALTRLPDWLSSALPAIVADPASGLKRSDRHMLHLAQTANARHRRDDQLFELSIAAAELEAENADERAAIIYERCLFARDRLDYPAITKLLPALSGSDPVWMLRKSAMLAFLKEKVQAVETAYEALLDICSRRARDRRSVWLLSREAWAHLIVQCAPSGLQDKLPPEFHVWPPRYRAAGCDPWMEFMHFDQEVTRARQDSFDREDEPSFAPGVRRTRYKRPLSRETFATPFQQLLYVADHVGLARMPFIDLIESRLQLGALLLGEGNADVWNILLAVRDWDRGLINQRFNRIAVARLEHGLVVEMIDRLKAAIDFGRARLAAAEINGGDDDDESHRSLNWSQRLRLLLELLSRFAVRLNPDEAIVQFRWACSLAESPAWKHWWLFEAWGHLMERTLEAVPPSRRGELASNILMLPQPGEQEMRGLQREWPILTPRLQDNAVILKREDPVWRNRISLIIRLLRSPEDLVRSRALTTLYVLHKKDILTDEEQAATASGIWDRIQQPDGYPQSSQLMSHVFLDLPEPAPGVAADAFRREIVTRIMEGRSTTDDEQALAGAANARHSVRLSAEEAHKLALRLLAWRPPVLSKKPSQDWGRDAEMKDKAFGIMAVLDQAILPVLTDDLITDIFVDELMGAAETMGSDMIEVLPALVERRPELGDKAFAVMRRALASRSAEEVYPASRGLARWLKAAQAGDMRIPSAMPSEIAAIVSNRREPALRPALSLAAHLIEMELMPNSDQERLAEALDVLAIETAYDNQDRGGLREETLTLVRANCVRLANALSKRAANSTAVEQWLAIAPADPIPEVRFALESEY